eukprot:796583-Alexandrium_andersonii.AAC.1
MTPAPAAEALRGGHRGSFRPPLGAKLAARSLEPRRPERFEGGERLRGTGVRSEKDRRCAPARSEHS